MPILNPDIASLLKTVSSIAGKHNIQCYLVGGFVRDYLLSRGTRDIDIAVSKNSLEVAKMMATTFETNYVLLDERNQIARVIIKRGKEQIHLDISTFSQDIINDLSRRDFTINSMALNLINLEDCLNRIIDPFGGRKDLKKHTLKAINTGVFRDDPSRILRAVRLAHILNFRIDVNTEKNITDNCDLISHVPGEKIREELLALLATQTAAKAFKYMDQLNLLTRIFPELENARGVEQPKEHYWDVFNHSLETIATVEFLLRESKWVYNISHLLTYSSWTRNFGKHFNKKVGYDSNRKQLLKLSGLLHDIAKPLTKKTDENGKISFIGHASQGADMAAAILKRLRFSKKEVTSIKILIQQHLRPVQLSSDRMPTKRAIYRYFRDTQDYGIDILYLALADYLAARVANLDLEGWKAVNKLCKYVVDEHQDQENKTRIVKLVDGNDLISMFKISPGPLIGRLLSIIHEAQAAGEIHTRKAALELAAKKFKQYHYRS